MGETVLLAGATGTIGQATAKALVAKGYRVLALVRPGRSRPLPDGVEALEAQVTDPASLAETKASFDAVISCLASRTGTPEDAWAIDHQAQANLLDWAKTVGATRFVLLSAICVQKPKLPFQHAKLAFEAELQRSLLTHSIVRPTAYFKSLSGQVSRLRKGKPFLLFGDGALTACKPISDQDLAHYLTGCLSDTSLQNKILPIGGPGPALTPMQQGKALFAALNLPPKFKHISVATMDRIIWGLETAGRLWPKARDKAELARIGRYYATESMLVWDPKQSHYDAAATPEFGTDQLENFYADLAAGRASVDLGDHGVF